MPVAIISCERDLAVQPMDNTRDFSQRIDMVGIFNQTQLII
jgi:hypothetical protein